VILLLSCYRINVTLFTINQSLKLLNLNGRGVITPRFLIFWEDIDGGHIMSAGKIIAYIGAAILIFFGVLFIWGSFSSAGSPGWILVGLISVGIGLVLVFFASRKPAAPANQNVTVKIDLPGNVQMDTMKCKSCGGTIGPDNIQLVNGAPVVTCPYCHTSYQLTEEPKW
jgi:hypothetical protein